MTTDLKSHLSNLLNEVITNISSVNGGDISQAFVIETEQQKYFVKTNTFDKYSMFQAEVKGLQTIANTNTIATPKVYLVGTFDNTSFLLMEWIEVKPPNSKDFETLGTQLAQLHQKTATTFGLETDNFIGSLHQSNNKHTSWAEFYIKERLIPQLNLAKKKGLLSSKEIPAISAMKVALLPLFENIKPSLLHGDLWGGNYIISNDDTPYLIDPAVYYGHSEVDIAMTKLFGGFSNHFYKAYFDKIPKDSNTIQRMEFYQLYYLLVHLNLFGRSYYGSVAAILKNFFT